MCPHCKKPDCKARYYDLCPICKGEGCTNCAGSLVHGIVDATTGPIHVCTQWHDPEIDAALDDSKEDLVWALTYFRDDMMAELNGKSDW